MLRITEDLESQFYIGHHHSECPYLPGRMATLFFLDGTHVGELYRILLDDGYRRNGSLLYRTECDECHECQVIRLPVENFLMTRSQKRVWKKGESSFTSEVGKPSITEEKKEMYRRYLSHQHKREENVDSESYEDFFEDTFLGERTLELRLYSENRLAGVGILDRVGDVLSSVYFYFDPDFAHLSPGVYSILKEIELCREWNLRYHYPGYYIADCPAMNYKAQFGPAQLHTPGKSGWQTIHPEQFPGR